MSRYNDTSRPAPGADHDLDNEALESLGQQREYDEEMEQGREEYARQLRKQGTRNCPPEPSINKARETP